MRKGPQDPLTIEVARQLLFTSFFLSQGDGPLQACYFDYLALQCPAWRLESYHCTALEQMLRPTIAQLEKRGVHKTILTSELEDELSKQVRAMQLAFASPPVDRMHLYKLILRNMIARDWRFLCEIGSRPARATRTALHASHPRYDPYLSHVCYFLLLKQTIGIVLFDQLFQELSAQILEKGLAFTSLSVLDYMRLGEVIAIYNLHHPTTPVQGEL